MWYNHIYRHSVSTWNIWHGWLHPAAFPLSLQLLCIFLSFVVWHDSIILMLHTFSLRLHSCSWCCTLHMKSERRRFCFVQVSLNCPDQYFFNNLKWSCHWTYYLKVSAELILVCIFSEKSGLLWWRVKEQGMGDTLPDGVAIYAVS